MVFKHRLTARTMVIFSALLLVLTACGGGEDLIGDSVSAGQPTANQFCELADSTPEDSEDFEAALVHSTRILQVLPSDAPEDVRELFAATQEAAALGVSSNGDLEQLDVDELSRASDVINTLESVDLDAVETWIDDTCGTQGAADKLLGATGSAGETSSDRASASTPAAEPTPTPEPTPIPTESITLIDKGHSGIFRDRELTIDLVVATNKTYETYFESGDLAHDGAYLMVHMFSQTNAHDALMPRENFSLVSPDGRPTTADKLLTAAGSSTSSIRLDSRDSADFVIAFETDELLADLTDWVMLYGSETSVAEPFPLSGDYQRPYPIALTPPDAPHRTLIAEFSTCTNYANTTITNAQVNVEAPKQGSQVFSFDRSAPDTRFVFIELDIANNADDDCEQVMAEDYSYGWRLNVDGRTVGFDGGAEGSAQVSEGISRSTYLRFEVPTTAKMLELVDEDDVTVASWNVELPLLLGES